MQTMLYIASGSLHCPGHEELTVKNQDFWDVVNVNMHFGAYHSMLGKNGVVLKEHEFLFLMFYSKRPPDPTKATDENCKAADLVFYSCTI